MEKPEENEGTLAGGLLPYVGQMSPQVMERLHNLGADWGALNPEAVPTDLWPSILSSLNEDALRNLAQVGRVWYRIVDEYRHRKLPDSQEALPSNQIKDGVATVFTNEQLLLAMGQEGVDAIHIRTKPGDEINLLGTPVNQAQIHAYGQAHITVSPGFGGYLYGHDQVWVTNFYNGAFYGHDSAHLTNLAGGIAHAHDSAEIHGVSGGTVSAWADSKIFDISNAQGINVHSRVEVHGVSGGTVNADGESKVFDFSEGSVIAAGSVTVDGVSSGTVIAGIDSKIFNVSGGTVNATYRATVTNVSGGTVNASQSANLVNVTGGMVEAQGTVTVVIAGHATLNDDFGHVLLNDQPIVTGPDGAAIPDTVTVSHVDGQVWGPERRDSRDESYEDLS
ncbi:MAG: hypothetical protein H0T78_02260 [Longispora sp.]|nr:hypothetical protein [Longispora sp. (in: high G+C Gram-positive bacteria)]